jgi:hypothetical protein
LLYTYLKKNAKKRIKVLYRKKYIFTHSTHLNNNGKKTLIELIIDKKRLLEKNHLSNLFRKFPLSKTKLIWILKKTNMVIDKKIF